MSEYAVMPLTDYKNACDTIRTQATHHDIDQIKSGELSDRILDVYLDGETDGYSQGKDSGYNEGFDVGYEAGQKSEYDKFWDNFQYNGGVMNYYYAFYGSRWNDENYNPKYDIVCADSTTAGQNLFRGSQITDTKVPITIINSGQAAFYGCPNLTTIRKLVVTENTIFTNMFYTTYNINHIIIEGTIAKDFDIGSNGGLNKESVVSIMTALSDTATDKTCSISLIAVKSAFETEDGVADGNTSEEWLALVNAKPNWTITLK